MAKHSPSGTRLQRMSRTGSPASSRFLCYWCSYTGADNAGTARLKYPPNVDIIRVMCSGRIDPELITAAFAQGADGSWCAAATSATATTSRAITRPWRGCRCSSAPSSVSASSPTASFTSG